MTPLKTKILAVLKNDIFWIFFISAMAMLFGKLANVYDSQLFEDIGMVLVVIAVAYFLAWCIISVIKQTNKK